MTTTHSKPTTKQKSSKPTSQIQQVNTPDEASYYDYQAELALIKADYFHMQYS